MASIIPFAPIQSGSGVASPDNVRPISASVTICGKNLFDEASYPLTSGWVAWTSGVIYESSNYKSNKDFIPFDYGGQIITLNKRPGGANPGFAFFSDNPRKYIGGEANSSATAGTPWTITVPEGTKYMRFTVPADATDIQIEFGSESTEYEPYTSTDIYGGYLDIVNKKLVCDTLKITLDYDMSPLINNREAGGGYTLNVRSGNYRPYFEIGWTFEEYLQYEIDADRLNEVRVDKLNYKGQLSSSSGINDNYQIGVYLSPSYFYTDGNQLGYFYLSTELTTEIDVETLRMYFSENPVTITYPLKYPITYSLSSGQLIQVMTQLGVKTTSLMESRRRILLNTPHLESASGSVARFKTDMSAKLKECRVNFLPDQAGSGDPSPSNVREIFGWTGINLYQIGDTGYPIEPLVRTYNSYGVDWTVDENSKVTFDGTPYSWSSVIIGYVDVNGDETIYLRYYGTFNNMITSMPVLYNANNNVISNSFTDNAYNVGADLSQYDGVKRIRVGAKRNSNDIYMHGNFMAVVSAGSPVEPNQISVTFPHIGKNLFNINHFKNKTGVTIYGNTIRATATTFVTICGRGNGTYMPLNIASGNTITLSFNAYTDGNVGTTGDGFALVLVYSDGTYARFAYTSNSETTSTPHTATTTLSKDVIGLAFGYYENTGNIWYLSNVQLEIGSAATAFEPYNTFYGGYVDLLRGELVQEWNLLKLTGNESWLMTTSTLPDAPYRPNIKVDDALRDYHVPFCDKLIGTSDWQPHLYNVCMNNSGRLLIGVPEELSTSAKVNEWIQSIGGIDVVYKLATPITYPLSPEIIKAIKGVNNVFSDANGDVEVKFWRH